MLAFWALAMAASTSIAPGESSSVAVEVDLARAPSSALTAAIANVRSAKELKLDPKIEVVAIAARRAKLTYVLSLDAAATTGTFRLFAVLEVRDKIGPLANVPIDHAVEPADPKEAERARLRERVASPDPAISDAALLSLGSVFTQPTPAQIKAASGETIERSLNAATSALEAGRLEEAEAYLGKLRTNGRLTTAELANVLALSGALFATRGRTAEEEQSFGRALCIDPRLEPRFLRRLHAARFDLAKRSANACTAPITVGKVTASRADAKTVFVRAEFSRDPYELIGGGDIEVFGSGGGVQRASKVRAAGGALEATIEEGAENQTSDSQLVLRIVLRDISGVVIASFGDPDPLVVPLEGDGGGEGVPWWVWAIAGGVVAAGAATTAIVLGTDRDVRYGIGPVSAEF